MIGQSGGFRCVNESAQLRARRWLMLAVSAVAVSGFFAILIALARVPAIGTLFPGAEFYRVALVLHVNLSQGVWFMAFASVLWSMASEHRSEALERASWGLAVAGTAGMILAVSDGHVRPLMSNYLPVLDNQIFLVALSLFGLGVCLKAWLAVGAIAPATSRYRGFSPGNLLLRLSALETLAVFMLLAGAWLAIDGDRDWAYFESLFWGAGHLWQFALVSLLMYCWLALMPEAARRLPASAIKSLILLSVVPVVLGLFVPVISSPGEAAHTIYYTWLMQWTSWQAPLALGLLLMLIERRDRWLPGFGLSLLLFVAGLGLGALINGQTTLITAHYHGTIGAITLAFMALCFRLLPSLGMDAPSPFLVRLQLAFYGNGILLMMLGLAGAGLMGAPRKTPGDLQLTFSIETVSRIFLGLGGLCATVGIIMFAWLLLRRLFSSATEEAYSL